MAKVGKALEKAIKDLDKADGLITDVRDDIDAVAMAAPDQDDQPAETAAAMADSLTAILVDLDVVINTLEAALKYMRDAAKAIGEGKDPPPPKPTQLPA